MRAAFTRRSALVIAGLACFALAGPAQAKSESFTVKLTGAQQVPAVATKGHGLAHVTFDPGTGKITWSITYHEMSSPVTMAHFHGPAGEGKNGPVEIWLTKKGEPVKSPFKGEAMLNPDQVKQLEAGELYINVHTKDHPAGEIRGQVVPPKM